MLPGADAAGKCQHKPIKFKRRRVSDRSEGIKRTCERQNEDVRVIYSAPSTAKHDNETLLRNWA